MKKLFLLFLALFFIDYPGKSQDSIANNSVLAPATKISSKENPDFLKYMEGQVLKFHFMANLLSGILITMGVFAIAGSIYVATFVGIHDHKRIKLAAFASTLLLTLIGAFNLPSKASGERSAWKHMNKAVLQYKNGIINADQLIKVYAEGEDMAGFVDFNYNSSKE